MYYVLYCGWVGEMIAMIHWQRVQFVLDSLCYKFDEFEVDHFVRHLEHLRGRSIVRMSYDFDPSLTGLWIPAETADYIFYTRFTHPIHQVHITLHEIAHMVLGHACKRIDQIVPPTLLNTFQSSDKFLGRVSDDSETDFDEQEAEAFVYLIQQRIVAAKRFSQLTHGQSSIDGLNRFTDSLGLMKQPRS
jgi:hypothetical protein